MSSISKKISITLDERLLNFIDQQTSNRSAFINDLILKAQKQFFRQELAKAYQEQSQDKKFQDEVVAWDEAVGDGVQNA